MVLYFCLGIIITFIRSIYKTHLHYLNYFRGFLPNAVYYIRRLPGLSILLNLPVISTVSFYVLKNNKRELIFKIILIFFFSRFSTNWSLTMLEHECNKWKCACEFCCAVQINVSAKLLINYISKLSLSKRVYCHKRLTDKLRLNW